MSADTPRPTAPQEGETTNLDCVLQCAFEFMPVPPSRTEAAIAELAALRAEVERLRAVIRSTHRDQCSDTRHAPECLLFEIEEPK